jgi:hypothetical protein
MDSGHQTSNAVQPAAGERFSFDQYVELLPASKQSAHRVLVWVIGVAFVLAIGLFIYAIYTSVIWKSAGGLKVVIYWQYFFLAGAFFALLLGIDTLILGATVPLPFEGSKYSYTTGRKAVSEGWTLVGVGGLLFVLMIALILALRAGYLSLETWITLVVGFWVVVGLAAAVLAVIRRISGAR